MPNTKDTANVRRANKRSNRAKLRNAINVTNDVNNVRNSASNSTSDQPSAGLRSDDGEIPTSAGRSAANPFRVAVDQRPNAESSGNIISGVKRITDEVQQTGNGIRRRRRSRNPITGQLEYRNDSNATANSSTDYIGSTTEEETIPREPIPIRRRRRRVKTDDFEKAAMLGLIAVGCTSLFETIALFAGKHWSLEEYETISLAQAIDSALDTLPGNYYATIRKVIENYFPWLTLSIVASKIVIPRINEGVERRKQQQSANQNQSDTVTEDSAVHRETTVDTGAFNGNAYNPKSSFR